MNDLSPRKIESLADIAHVLDSPRASSTELYECTRLARKLRDPELRRKSAIRLLESLKAQPKHSGLEVLDAARHVVASSIQSAQQLEQLAEYLSNVKRWLEDIRNDSSLKTNETEELVELVSETLLLVSSTDDQSTVELSSRLRKLENSELAATIVAPLVSRDPSNRYATNTYCAALVDIGRASEVVPLLKDALRKDSQNTHNLLVLSRAYSWLGNHREAHHAALNAFRLNPGEYSARRLLASASEVEDGASFEDALRVVEEALDAHQRALSPNVLLLAAEELVEANNTASASVAIKKLLEFKWKGANAKRVSALRRWLNDQGQLRLDLGGD
jgi:predicted Zn-dependent protease